MEPASIVYWDTEFTTWKGAMESDWGDGALPMEILQIGAVKWMNPTAACIRGEETPILKPFNALVRAPLTAAVPGGYGGPRYSMELCDLPLGLYVLRDADLELCALFPASDPPTAFGAGPAVFARRSRSGVAPVGPERRDAA